MTDTNVLEKKIISFLSENLSVPVSGELPDNPTIPCVVVEKTAGSYENTILSGTYAVQSYGTSMAEASELNDNVKFLLLDGFITDNQVTDVTLNTDYNFTDTTAERYRYQAVFDIKFYRI